MLDEFDFFPTKRYFRRTQAWELAWQRNLARAPRRRRAEESLAIKHAVWDWRKQEPTTRPTVAHLAASLGVSKQYVSHLAHTLPPRIALPPVRHASIPQREAEPTLTVPVRPVLEGHGWNCECNGCRAYARIQAAFA
jgi:hypothetical protein